ncbi:MAG: Cof-type HAD-IIB family hydrolase [Clostridiales Family XIII bacterium]|jgi:Cof subfamily protein (haloacid dehalogenase superfamily)|nr:Cof-type HAD-IIB family hydrolase [Clostridiales Family XIII bacterium]
MDIRLLASDLDRTLLDSKHEVSAENKAALEACAEKGVVLVAATGRALSAVPEGVRKVRGMRYIVCSNGAKVFENDGTKLLYERYISREAVDYIRPLLEDGEVLCEFFWGGYPYVQQDRYDRHEAIPGWFLEYFLASRKPVPDMARAIEEHLHEIENINFVFADDAVKERLRGYLAARTDLYEFTSSMPFNFEIGGVGVSKASALDFVCAREGILPAQCICFGDSENDAHMIAWAGIGVAMGNAVPEAKAAAGHVTGDNEHSGVAQALYALGVLPC